MFTLPFNVERSVVIDCPPALIYGTLADFSTWPGWSPWLCQEPDCQIRIEGEPGTAGHTQRWDGHIIGAGSIRLASVEPLRRLDYELQFLKPWKSRSHSGFSIETADGGSRVRWWMRGSLPLFMFFMRRSLSAWVGSDYDRGLGMLKERLETGTVPSRVEVRGTEQRDGFHYIGLRRACPLGEIGVAMEKDFTRLGGMADGGRLPPPREVLSLYHRFDPAAGVCDYTACFTYAEDPGPVPAAAEAPLQRGRVPPHRSLRVDHIGAFRHLGNGWAAATGCQRGQYRLDKTLPMYEIYRDDPHEVAESELRTEIHLPVKS